jgi:predicted nucleic acid-binding protein
MIYLDTNVIVSCVDERDPNHDRARGLLSRLKGEKVVSKLTLVELTAVFSMASLQEPIPLALFSIKSVGAKIVNVDFEEALKRALSYAVELRLRALDLLHVAISKTIECRGFATLDEDIVKRARDIGERLGIEVVTA